MENVKGFLSSIILGFGVLVSVVLVFAESILVWDKFYSLDI